MMTSPFSCYIHYFVLLYNFPRLLLHQLQVKSNNVLPPFTSPLVQTADIDNVVKVVTTADKRMMTVAKPIPAWPTTQDSLKYSITPHMFRRQPNSTPLIQPNFGAAFDAPLDLISNWSPSSSLLSSSMGSLERSPYKHMKEKNSLWYSQQRHSSIMTKMSH